MKLNQIITGCALAAGLMAFAPQSQAGIVIENTLFAPVQIKATWSYVNSKGKIAKVSASNKDILKYYNYPKGSSLAMWDGDVYVISKDKKSVGDDLTALGELYFTGTTLIANETPGKNGAYKAVDSGLVEVDFYSNADSDLIDDDYSFSTTGTYSSNYSQSSVNAKTLKYNVSESITTSTLTGSGYNYDVSDVELPVSGTGSASGSGTLID